MKEIALLIAAGLIVGLGTQVAKYILPDPETRVVVCVATDQGIEACESAKDLLARERAKKGGA